MLGAARADSGAAFIIGLYLTSLCFSEVLRSGMEATQRMDQVLAVWGALTVAQATNQRSNDRLLDDRWLLFSKH